MNRIGSERRSQSGFVVSTELVIIGTIVVIGLIVGMVAIRDAMTAEMGDVAESLGAIDQSYSFEGITDGGTNAAVAGSQWLDTIDDGTGGGQGDQGAAGDAQGINFDVAVDGSEASHF